ncbi:unnamed protein product [Psylliodes chrysocephalus]|uniref:Uncharacterized protein n=1 Tax=Psylliodes chrysocephalus TaxID=3402493 RepID=A0A9P0G5E0_9CUCU|nr:unnamed protein product [Psylliodes chrysocephala]
MMTKRFFFCMSLKNGAWIMTASNMLYGVSSLLSAAIALENYQDEEDRLNLIMTILLGVFNIFVGGVMIYALIKGNERTVLLYILLEMVNLFIITVFSAINIFEYKSLTRSASLTGLCIGCVLLWYGLYCMVSFYNELEEYNKTTIKSGLIEYSATNGTTGLEPVMFPEKAIDSTAV